jgi:hypothetical protein
MPGGRALIQQLQATLFVLLPVLPRSAGPRLVLRADQPGLSVAPTPFTDGGEALAETRRDGLSAFALGRRQHDAGSQGQALSGGRGAHPDFEGGAVFVRERGNSCWACHAAVVSHRAHPARPVLGVLGCGAMFSRLCSRTKRPTCCVPLLPMAGMSVRCAHGAVGAWASQKQRAGANEPDPCARQRTGSRLTAIPGHAARRHPGPRARRSRQLARRSHL